MKSKTVFYCTECGNEFPKWAGQCSACGGWNTLVEAEVPREQGTNKSGGIGAGKRRGSRPVPHLISEVESSEELRFPTGLHELDRVLGGGAVQGSFVLVGGAPGVGKSTLMLQICTYLCKTLPVLYVSGEESERQLKLRADRLGVIGEKLYVLSETNLDDILDAASDLMPGVLIVDSIQTLYRESLTASPGSVGQVKECAMSLMRLAKEKGITVFLIGHVNKEGSIAGPKVLEHMVDCVLYFEGEQHMAFRILRAVKNRFGATNEIGVFEMGNNGLIEVPNPSEWLLAGRPLNTPGACVTCVIEGARPVLAEVQALVATTSFGTPRRTSNGFDSNRGALLLAVLEKRGGFRLSGCDVYFNVIGGLTIDEPAADLSATLAVASSYLERALPEQLAAVGELGLTGELRSVQNLPQRLSEIRRLGFESCLVPARDGGSVEAPAGLNLIPVRNLREALDACLL